MDDDFQDPITNRTRISGPCSFIYQLRSLMPLPAAFHCFTFASWLFCLGLFIFRKSLRFSHAIVGIGLLFVPICFMRAEFDQLSRVRGSHSLSGVYVYNAFRISDSEIRFFFMQSTDEMQSLQFLDTDGWKSVETTCVCPLSTLISQCSVEAHLGIIRTNSYGSLTLRVPKSTVEREVDVIDVRPKDEMANREYSYDHKLGVCIQPIYYHADWPVFIQFFEYWIAAGATKFYIYLHSATPQVRKVLAYYSDLLGAGLEIIPWSDLPVSAKDRGDFSRDPNTRVFRAGAYAAVNDCLLRSRWSVKFLAMMDVDEVVVIDSGGSLSRRIEDLANLNPFAATFSLEWRYGVFETDKHHMRARTPRNLSFHSHSEVKVLPVENVMFDYGRLRKIIQRPERVRITDIHNTITNENIPLPDDLIPLPYETAHVNSSMLSVLHLRRFNPRSLHSVSDNSTPANIDRKIITKMISNFKNRSALLNFDMGQWWRPAEQTMAELEACRKHPFNLGTRIGKGHCRSLANCEPTLSSAEAFVKEPSVWTNVAIRERFIQYVV
ncbi:hypothetical protein PRIPAC_77830 [Pristionchus pacificus]|nr:hypothetical protein PRIPAC_77830 [Pristionchus pacificus]